MTEGYDGGQSLIYLLSSRSISQVLSVLSHGAEPLTSTELAAATNMHRVTASKAVSRLVEAGLVIADHPQGSRVGRLVRYKINREALRAAIDDALGSPDL